MSVVEMRQRIAAIKAADLAEPGSTLRGGDSIGVWERGEHPYGQPSECPFCGSAQDYTALEYNGYGPPPQYAFRCCECGASGPMAEGTERGDHLGARREAVAVWNRRAPDMPQERTERA